MDAAAALADASQAFLDDDFDTVRRRLEQAFAALREAGELRAAVKVAAELAEVHSDTLGNRATGRGWIQRGRRLLTQTGRCLEQGYLELAIIACEVPDVLDLERSADIALELAGEFGDVSLEARALADGGLALVSQGRTREGFERLDEAMAIVAAGEVDMIVAGKAYCAMLSACDRAGDVERVREWARVVQEAVLAPLGGRPPILHSHCRIAYGSVLCTTGAWDDGEAALLDALGPQGSSSSGHRVEASARLAELRIAQGRLDEARALLRPIDDELRACLPLAQLDHLAGDDDLAAATIERALREIRGDRLRGATLLSLLVEVHLSRDDLEQAQAAADRLASDSAAADVPVLRAMAATAAGRVAAARVDASGAADAFRRARDELGNGERPLLAATIGYELARVLAEQGDVGGAVAEARVALATYERAGAALDADRTAALLRSLGERSTRRVASGSAAGLTAREQEVLNLLREGLTNAEIGGRLYISPKTAEHHVSRVLTKLGVRSRAEAAAVAAAAPASTE